jgi:spermidine/putrescine transport system ATP-binding protein
MNDPAVELLGVSKWFGGEQNPDDRVVAVNSIDLTLRRGEFFTLLGPSGCGKTTTLRIVAGFEDPSEGQLMIQGKPMNDVPANRRPVNMVFQNYALFPHLSVVDNVGFGLAVRRVPAAERRRLVAEAMALVQLDGYEKRRPSQLSGGQQQRVALARALVNRPAVLLLDEPLGALDLKLRKAMQLELKHLQEQVGITFLYVTHDQEEALTMSDRIAVMRGGDVLQIGTPAEIYERPADRFVADFIGESTFLETTVEGVQDNHLVVRLGETRMGARVNGGRLQPGEQVTLALRPERISVASAKGAGSTGLAGSVNEVVYLGTDIRYVVGLADGQRATARVQNARGQQSTSLKVGDAVRLVWDPEDALPLPDPPEGPSQG